MCFFKPFYFRCSKPTTLLCVGFMLFGSYSIATNPIGKNELNKEAIVKQSLPSQPVFFQENKGQMMDMEGKPVDFVLFKAEAPGMHFYITETGATYVFQQLRKELIAEIEVADYKKIETEQKSKSAINKFTDWERIDLVLKGASIKKENIVKEEASKQGHKNFFYPHCPDGIYNVKEYGKVTIKNIYPNIDWVFYNSDKKGYKYDFVVHSGADYSQIELLYKSRLPITITETGSIRAIAEYGELQEEKPVSFINGKEIESRYQPNYQKTITLNGDKGYETSISFYLNLSSSISHDTSAHKPAIVIDPQLTWGTFYGGNNSDGLLSIDTDPNGNVFITGFTNSTNFPVQNAGTFFQGTSAGPSDVLILKFDNNGVRLWATYYGGSSLDNGISVSSDNNGNVFITGETQSTNFPVQNAGTFFQGAHGGGNFDTFILKFDNSGTRLWATYYGGSDDENANYVTCDNNGNVFITGDTKSNDFPLQNAGTFFQGAIAGNIDAFILKFNNNGTRLWSTYYGGSDIEQAFSITSDSNGNVFITGVTSSTNFPVQNAGTFFQGAHGGGPYDAFILKFDNIGTRLWATYYGGSGVDIGYCIITDLNDNIFVTGETSSINFPVQNAGTFFQGNNGGNNDVFILKFQNNGTRLWATYYGGSDSDDLSSYDNLVTDTCGHVLMSFTTTSPDLPLQVPCSGGYIDTTYVGKAEVALVHFANDGTRLWASYLGGDGNDFGGALSIDVNNNFFITGSWADATPVTYPLLDPGGSAYFDNSYNGAPEDGFIVKFTPSIASSLTSTTTDNCGGCNGSATVSVANLCAPYDYYWSNSSQALASADTFNTITGLCAGTYYVTITSFCDTLVDTVIITATVPSLTTQNPEICQGDSLFAGGAFQNTTGTYNDTLTAGNGCDSIVITNLTVSPPPNATITGTTIICEGSQAQLTASGGGNYSWSNGSTSPSITTGTAGTYTVTVTIGSCTDFATHTLTTNPNPTADAGTDVTMALGNETNLQATGGGEYRWSPPEGLSCTTCENPIAKPTATTKYCVEVKDNNGCTDVDCITIEVEIICGEVFVPNAFSPNGDGENDELCVYNHCISEMVFQVYDRWGERVFESTNQNFCWDGTFRGKPLNPGVFVYRLNATIITGEEIDTKGNISLVK